MAQDEGAKADENIVFISYSHEDRDWKDRLVKQLEVLKVEGMLDPWDDHRIGAGLDWLREIRKAMNKASVAVLMISADFLVSKFIRGEEVPKILERREREGLRIFPIIVRPCLWKHVKWLKEMQVRPLDGVPLSSGDENKIEEELTTIAAEIADIVEGNA